jgi:drug/metabolite transporter (DMT)-like permease
MNVPPGLKFRRNLSLKKPLLFFLDRFCVRYLCRIILALRFNCFVFKSKKILRRFMKAKQRNWSLVWAIVLLYITWSSTYFAIRIAVQTINPMIMIGFRFVFAGILMYVLAICTGSRRPTLKQWMGGFVIGILLFLCSNVLLGYAEQTVGSGLSAVSVSSGALWICLFSGMFGKWPNRMEWAGIAIGLIGIVILNLGSEMKSNINGMIMLIVSSMIWGLGTVLSKKLPLPSGFMGSAVEMLGGGICTLIMAAATGQDFNVHSSPASMAAFIYLIVAGSMIGFSAFMYVFHHARPALASSYAYVTPIGAIALGIFALHEKINRVEVIAMVFVVIGVLTVILGGSQEKRNEKKESIKEPV